ncbi:MULTISPECIES: type IV pilin protein [Pseudomonas]|jgi:type IV pilus assembly protein PilE|uniref:type IV pilin protein n=1 Tax=Pseudomonas TaxID=286 RepID=UPI000730C8D4|nr:MULTISPECIES: type IV pilin protein [Pseudomonas]AMO79036.1 Fimbrial protein precursor [Pseudomonas citronellolis]KSW25583.1 pilus assembly protein PilE [Pseudomonas sp. ADP]OBP11495.1 pilus assembly protein PilE [Pseudomonas sp. EGD-AKN5]QOF82166.1 type IV pilin protein [Pseudomonas sp. ADPe]
MSGQNGFSLLELMIVVVIVGILASVAYPSYVEYARRSDRAEGQALLMEAAARQERFFAQNRRYVVADADIASLGLQATSRNGRYVLTLSAGEDGDGGYLLEVEPQRNDPRCGTLTLNALGQRSPATSECWR